MKNKLSIVLGTSLSLALLGCLAGAPKTKTVKAEGQNLKTDTITITSFKMGDTSSYSTGRYAYLADGSNSYTKYGATASASGNKFGLKAGPEAYPYDIDECYNFSSIQSYGSLVSLTLNFSEANSIPSGAELVCYYSSSETQFSYADNVYYGRASYDKLFTLDSDFTENTYTFDIPDGTTVKSFSFMVTGTSDPIYFDSLSFTWDLEPNRIIQNIDTWRLDVSDGPQDSPVITTSDMDLTYEVSYGDYILEYDTETEKFIPLGYGSVYVQVKSEYESYSFNACVTEDVETVVLHSNDTPDVAVEGWEEVTDPSTLAYGDVITFFSREAYEGAGAGICSYENDGECGKFNTSVTYDYDVETERLFGDDFMKFMLVPGSTNSAGFSLLSLSGSKDQFLREAIWQVDIGSLHYETKYSILIGEPTEVPSAWNQVSARDIVWSFESTETTFNDTMIVKDPTEYYGPHLGLAANDCIDFVSNSDSAVTVYRYVGELNETYNVSDIVSDASGAITFAHGFLAKMGEVCLTGADNVKTRFAKFFTSMGYGDEYTKYNYLGNKSLYVLKNARADETGDVLQKFASLYDFIVTEYGVTDYLGRNPSLTTGSNSIGLGTNSSVAAIVTIASVGALISLLYVAFRSSKKVTD